MGAQGDGWRIRGEPKPQVVPSPPPRTKTGRTACLKALFSTIRTAKLEEFFSEHRPCHSPPEFAVGICCAGAITPASPRLRASCPVLTRPPAWAFYCKKQNIKLTMTATLKCATWALSTFTAWYFHPFYLLPNIPSQEETSTQQQALPSTHPQPRQPLSHLLPLQTGLFQRLPMSKSQPVWPWCLLPSLAWSFPGPCTMRDALRFDGWVVCGGTCMSFPRRNTLPQAGWPQTAEMDSCWILEARSAQSRCQPGPLSESLEEGPCCPLAGGCTAPVLAFTRHLYCTSASLTPSHRIEGPRWSSVTSS